LKNVIIIALSIEIEVIVITVIHIDLPAEIMHLVQMIPEKLASFE